METDRLIEHLNSEISCYKDYISVLQRETENLVARNYQGLFETTGEKEKLLAKLDELGRARKVLMDGLFAALGVENDGRLSTLVNNSRGEDREGLGSCRETIVSLAESIKEITQVNTHAVRDSLDNVNKALGLLRQFSTGSVYRPTGSFDSPAMKGSRISEGA